MTCSRVVIIHEGQVVAEDTIESLTQGLDRFQTVRVRTAREQAGTDAVLRALPGVEEVVAEGPSTFLVRLRGGDDARAALASAVVGSGAGLVELVRQTASLEEVFLKLVAEEAAA